ncbi:MAG: hypothetical protein L2C94_005255 [Aigarchaeota archaeon]|nr:hypothetical protein [Candidatus Wolframiiraptor gerlachensis]
MREGFDILRFIDEAGRWMEGGQSISRRSLGLFEAGYEPSMNKKRAST